MRRVSKKTAGRIAECADLRKQLVRDVGHCEMCGHDPKRTPPMSVAWALHVHEIARGQHRQKALDKRFALLVVCYRCHMERLDSRAEWPESRQLAALKRSRPREYDLEEFLRLKNPNAMKAITEDEVDAWL